CKRTLRRNSQSSKDHPDTIPHTTRGYCATRYHRAKHLDGHIRQPGMRYRTLSPADLADQRHISLTDDELEHLRDVSTTMYDWHIKRRKRLKLGQYRTR